MPNGTIQVDGPEKLCPVAQKADEEERVLAGKRKSPALDAALQSESVFWKFLIDPSTPYLDRMAAAYRGGNLVSPEQLPRLWEAYAQFETLPYGVSPSPCAFTFNAWAARSPAVWARRNEVPIPGTVSPKAELRNLLGFDVHLPDKALDYPLDVATRMNTPWVWQMWRALSTLRAEVERYYAQPDHYGAMVEVAFRWHPTDFYARRVRASAIEFGPRNAAWVEAQMTLLLETEDDAGAGSSAVNIYAGGDSDHMKALVSTAFILILQRTHNPKIAFWSASELARLAAARKRWPSVWKALPTATPVLAIAHWYHLFPKNLRPMLDKELTDAWAQPGSPFEFEKWVEQERSRLEVAAAEEFPNIRVLGAEMHCQVEPISAWHPQKR